MPCPGGCQLASREANSEMPIESDEELSRAAAEASRLLQEIQDYIGFEPRPDAQVRFPRGVISTASHYRSHLPGYLPYRQRSSCAYGLMFTDVLWWITHRTDISSVAEEMAYKAAIVTLGTVVEATLHIPNEGIFDSNAGVKPRLERAQERGWINVEDRDTLKRLWDDRCNVHTRLLGANEFNLYTVDRVASPMAALKRLLRCLREWHVARA